MTNHIFGVTRPVLGKLPVDATVAKEAFQPLPKPISPEPFHLDIKNIIPISDYNQILATKQMHFNSGGDVGGVKNPADQIIVSEHMEMQFDKLSPLSNPTFYYILGDVVYYYGEVANYNSQFYDPYKFYNAPIFAIPGNHDGDIDPTDASKPTSLAAFVKLFCSGKPVIPAEAGDATRTTMIQPYVYWTLVTPVANIIGLYTNVPSGGVVKDDQKKWLINELISAGKERKDKALIVALHHPPYSLDHDHGASVPMQQLLDAAFTQAKVMPDLILSGHVHNYQRFSRKLSGKQIPYIVAGSGGYWFMHTINTGGTIIKTPTSTPFTDVTLESYCENRHGFMRLNIDMNIKQLTVEYFTVPRVNESWTPAPVLYDTLKVDLARN